MIQSRSKMQKVTISWKNWKCKENLPQIFSSAGIIFVGTTDHENIDDHVDDDYDREHQDVVLSLSRLKPQCPSDFFSPGIIKDPECNLTESQKES